MTPRLHSLAARPAALLVVSALLACGGGSSPSNPSTPPPTMAPPPTTMPPAMDYLSATCTRLGLSPATGKEKCGPDSPTFASELDQAIDETVAQHPEWFDVNDIQGAGAYRVFSEGGFTLGVVRNLDKRGICGGLYGEELALKNNNDFSDNFDIITSTAHIRRGATSYRSTCVPASFSSPQPPAGNTPGCTLPNSFSLACSREENHAPLFLNQVMAAIDQVSKQHPEYFDFTDVQPGTDWFKVRNVDAYTKAVVSTLLGQSLCARWDGEELNVKSSNTNSENYDILTAQSYIRRGDGSYRVTCYPAYF